MKIRLQNDMVVEATYVRHLSTLTSTHGSDGQANIDVDLYRLADGTEVEALWPGDARCMPRVADAGSLLGDYS